jgi:hypothetical protein
MEEPSTEGKEIMKRARLFTTSRAMSLTSDTTNELKTKSAIPTNGIPSRLYSERSSEPSTASVVRIVAEDGKRTEGEQTKGIARQVVSEINCPGILHSSHFKNVDEQGRPIFYG